MKTPTQEQKLEAYEKALPAMQEAFAAEQKEKGTDEAAIEEAWGSMKEQLKEHFLTDPEVEKMVSMQISESEEKPAPKPSRRPSVSESDQTPLQKEVLEGRFQSFGKALIGEK